jgi:protein-disulfide isomerase
MPDSANPTKRERREAARTERLQREQAAAAGDLRRKRLLQLGGLLAAAAVIVIVAVLVSSGGGKKTSGSASAGVQGAAETKSLLGGIPQKGITLGKADAPVTIVEFADPQCPFCKDYTLNEMPALVQKYVRTGKAKMDLRFLTFIGPDSVTAARALLGAAAQGRFWNAADVFYRNQGQENSGYVTSAFLDQVLKDAGADPAKAIAAGGTPAVTQELGAAKTLASRYGVDSTPTILVGPTGGQLKKDTEPAPTAAGIGKLVDAAAAQGGK